MSQNKEIYGIRKRKVCGACSVLLATACFAISMGASVSADEWATSNPSELKVVAQEVDYTDEILGNSPDILSESQLYQGYQEGLVFSKAGISDTMIPHDGSGIVIATVDSGVDETHKIMRLDPTAKIKLAPQSAEFSDKIPFRYDFLSGDTDLADDSTEHGMHIVGVLVGNEENGFKGMAPNAQLLAYRTWSEDSREGFQEDYQFYAIEDALAKGADIISLSIGEVGSGRQDDVWYDIVKKAKEKDVIITAAMGNYGTAATTNSFDKFVNQAYSLTDDSTIVSLAANPDVLAVGSYYDTYMKLPHFKAWGMSFAYEDLNWHNYDLFKRKEQEEITFNDAVLYWNKTTNDNIKDKIVLIDRNQEKVFDQVLEVMKKDPKGIIMINAATPTTLGNYESIPEIRSATLDDQGDYFERIWAVSVSYKDGQLLKN